MAMTKRYDHANEERYGAAFEALDAAGKTGIAYAIHPIVAHAFRADDDSSNLWQEVISCVNGELLLQL